MSQKAEVAIVKDSNIKRRTLEALKLVGGMDKITGRGDTVFIKPNLVDGAPFATGEVVQLEVIEVLVQEALQTGASNVFIGETPTWRRKTKTVEAYEQAANQWGAHFLDLSQHPFIEVAVEDPILFPKVRVSKVLLDSDVFISVPTLKTHVQAGVTVSIKNMYGLIPGLPGHGDKRLYHQLDRVEEAILDLYQVRQADLIVVDGTYSTFHIGPRPLDDFTETFKLDLTVTGFDPVAIDTIGARILGIDPLSIRYLQWAEEKGLGTRDLAKINVLGTSVDHAHVRKGVDAVEFANARLQNITLLNYGACTGCLKYAPQTLRFGEEKLSTKTFLVMGPNANADQLQRDMSELGRVILCGYCAAPTFYNGLQGDFIPGCPPTIEDLQKKLREIAITDLD